MIVSDLHIVVAFSSAGCSKYCPDWERAHQEVEHRDPFYWDSTQNADVADAEDAPIIREMKVTKALFFMPESPPHSLKWDVEGETSWYLAFNPKKHDEHVQLSRIKEPQGWEKVSNHSQILSTIFTLMILPSYVHEDAAGVMNASSIDCQY